MLAILLVSRIGDTYVGVEDEQTKLRQLVLDVSEDSLLEDLSLSEDLLHSHARHKDSSFTLDDTLDDVGNMLALGDILLLLRVRQKHSILHQSVSSVLAIKAIGFTVGIRAVGPALVDIGTHCEDDGERELQLLLCHGLKVHGIVVRADADCELVTVDQLEKGEEYLKRVHRWRGQTHVAFVILTVLMPMPVMARYSSGAEIL